MIKALKAIAIALPVIAGSLLVLPPAAQAAPSDCSEPNNFCAWSNDGWAGRRVRWNQRVNDNNWGVHRGMSNDAESLYNHTLSSQTVVDNVQTYVDNNYGGASVCVLPGETVDVIGFLGSDENDLQSHQWVHSC